MRERLGGLDGLRRFHQECRAQLGSELAVVEERIETLDGDTAYVRRARYEVAPVVIEMPTAIPSTAASQ